MEHPEFAKRFNLAVQKAGVEDTLKALSRLLEVSQVTVWSYKSGTKLPRVSTAKRVAQKLGVSTEWLLDGTGRGPDELPEGIREINREVIGEPATKYGRQKKTSSQDDSLPEGANELIRLIKKEALAGRLQEQHFQLLKNTVKLMTQSGHKK